MKKITILILLIGFHHLAKSQLALDVESGVATFGYNDVRISGNEGTKFSLSDNFNTNKFNPYFRTRLQFTIGERHAVSALYAPLTIKGQGTSENDIYFQATDFKSGELMNTEWKFNSYRLTYQYNFIIKERFLMAAGLTVKIRDAKIALSNSQVTAEKTNLGVVPLVRFYADWNFVNNLHLIVDGDALVGKQGRAEDVLFAIGYNVSKPLRLKLGYRLLEGGADNDEVYNFSAVHYASISASWAFKK